MRNIYFSAVLISLGLLFCFMHTSAQDTFLLSKHRAGQIEIGMKIDDLHTKFEPSSTKLVATYPEGMFTPLLQIYLEGAATESRPPIVINLEKEREWIVDGIEVNDNRFRTAEGIGIGSTLGQIRKAYAVKWIGFGEGPLIANIDELDMSFELDFTDPPSEWYKTNDQRLIPDSAKVVSIYLYRNRTPAAEKK
jgi:hypothetical protein